MTVEKLQPQLVTLCDRLGNHRTARTLCALVESDRLILCAPVSLRRFSEGVTLLVTSKRLHGTLRPLPDSEQTTLHARFSAAFPQTAQAMARLPELELMLFVPDAE